MLAVASGSNLPFPSTRTAVLRLVYAPFSSKTTAAKKAKEAMDQQPDDFWRASVTTFMGAAAVAEEGESSSTVSLGRRSIVSSNAVAYVAVPFVLG